MTMKGRIHRPEEKSNLILPRIGFIKTGKKGEKGTPQSVDYFIASGKYASHFEQAYGLKPNTIQVVFIDDNISESCRERYEYRDKQGKLYAQGDGQEFKVWDGEQYKEFNTKEHPDIMERVDQKVKGKKGWEVILTLRFIIPKVSGIVGFWEFTTRGESSTIPQIRGTIDSLIENRGFIKGIPFDLNVEFAKSQKPDAKNRYPVVNLVPNVSEENVKMIQDNLLKLEPPEELTGDIQKQLEEPKK